MACCWDVASVCWLLGVRVWLAARSARVRRRKDVPVLAAALMCQLCDDEGRAGVDLLLDVRVCDEEGRAGCATNGGGVLVRLLARCVSVRRGRPCLYGAAAGRASVRLLLGVRVMGCCSQCPCATRKTCPSSPAA